MDSRKLAGIKDLCCLGLDDRAFIPALSAELHSIVPSHGNNYLWLDASLRVSNLYGESSEAWRLLPLYMQEFMNKRELDAFPGVSEIARRGPVVATTEQVMRDGFYRSEFYNEILRPVGYHHFASAVVNDGGRPLGVLLLHRGKNEPAFQKDELQRLRTLLPFVAHGMASARKIRFPSVNDGDVGMLIFDRGGKLQFASNRARQILFMYTSPGAPQAQAVAAEFQGLPEIKRLCARLSASLNDSAHGIGPPVWRHENPWGRFVFRAYWLDSTVRSESALIGITLQHDVPLPLKLRRHAKRLGLSPKQVRVCSLLASGCSNDEIAKQMGITHSTVIDHVRKLFDKLEVHNRNALLSKIMDSLV
jgi:DNA-binding CsgD family transcriptional regulator